MSELKLHKAMIVDGYYGTVDEASHAALLVLAKLGVIGSEDDGVVSVTFFGTGMDIVRVSP